MFPPPTQAVHGADICAGHPSQQLPGLLLRKASFMAKERPFFFTEKNHVFQAGKNKVRVRSHISKYTFHMETPFPPSLGRQSLPSDEDMKLQTKQIPPSRMPHRARGRHPGAGRAVIDAADQFLEGVLLSSLQNPTVNAPSPVRQALAAAGRLNPSTLQSLTTPYTARVQSTRVLREVRQREKGRTKGGREWGRQLLLIELN